MAEIPQINVSQEELRELCRRGRLVGSQGNRETKDLLRRWLEEAGWAAVEDPPPTLSDFLLAAGLIGLLAALHLGLMRGQPASPLFSGLIGGLVVLAWQFFHVRRGTRAGAPGAIYGMPKAIPSSEKPAARFTVILCAHYDSAALPLGLRGSPVALLGIFFAFFVGVILAGTIHPYLAIAGAIGAMLFAIRLFFLGNDSPGADDNASGVLAVLECLRRLKSVESVDVIPVFFNYEEVGLVGSRVWVGRHLAKRTGSGLNLDPSKTFVINFDTVGRGRHIYVSGSRKLRERLLQVARARALPARRAYLYPSDHLSFRPRWNAVSVFRADRLWFLDLGWVHSRRDSPDRVRLDHLAEAAALVEAFVRDLASGAPERPQKPSRPWARAFFSRHRSAPQPKRR